MRSAVDMAEDAKQPALAEWLRARGGRNADGPMRGRLLKNWQAEGWKGNKVPFRPDASWKRSLNTWDAPTSTGHKGSVPKAAATSQSSSQAWWSQNWDSAAAAAPRSGEWENWTWQQGKWQRYEAQSSGKGSK